MRFLQWLLGGLALLALLYFVGLNGQMTSFYWDAASQPFDAPVYMILIVTFVAGYLIGLFYYWLGSVPHYLKRQKDIHTLERRIRDLEAELEDTQA